MVVEKNDVDISKLFKWGGKFLITSPDGEVFSVYIRLVNDAEFNRARVYALRESSSLRSKLKNKKSDEYLGLIKPIENLDKQSLIELILLNSVGDITNEVVKKIHLPEPREPRSDDSLEVWERYQREIDEYETKREETIYSAIQTEIDKKRKALKKRNKNLLIQDYKKLLINRLCEQRLNEAFIDYCAMCGTFTDEKFTNRLCDNITEFNNLIPSVKEQIIKNYLTLDIQSEELKK